MRRKALFGRAFKRAGIRTFRVREHVCVQACRCAQSERARVLVPESRVHM